MNMKDYKKMIDVFDRYSFYTHEKIERDIENNRKGAFALEIVDENGLPIKNASVKVKQLGHEFNFGCSSFLLDEFDTKEENEEYRKKFKKIFNYAVVPLYWDTLEPEQGKPRFSADSPKIWRRPAVERVVDYCKENDIKMKGHCLMYHSFNPSWMSDDHRIQKMQIDKRLKEIGEFCGNEFEDVDVINELHCKYKNLYGQAESIRRFPCADDKDHVHWCFDEAKKHFPFSRLFWNEGCFETFGEHYQGDKSYYYLMLKRYLGEGVPIEGIGMQFHAFSDDEKTLALVYNALRMLDLIELYSEFDLPIHLSEISIPSYSNDSEGEQIQAELVKRMYTLWFSQKNITATVWWNLVDNTAYGNENRFHAGLLRRDMSEKPAFKVLDKLINEEWHTEFETSSAESGIIEFCGFYGDYEISVERPNEKPFTQRVRLTTDRTGYHHHENVGFGLRKTKINVK